MKHHSKNGILGVLGGMGPLASSAFLNTLYEHNLHAGIEQNAPDIVLYSVSSLPDRTEKLMSNDEKTLAERLQKLLAHLTDAGADRIVMCCFTSHCFIKYLPPNISRKLISLVDVTMDELLRRQQRSLLLATKGFYQKAIFKSHPKFAAAAEYLVVPDKKDQEKIHGIIYGKLKRGVYPEATVPEIMKLMHKYETEVFVAGCTEFHLVTRFLLGNGVEGIDYIDPLLTIADNLPAYIRHKR